MKWMEVNEEREEVQEVRVRTKKRRSDEEHDGIRKGERGRFVFGVAKMNNRCVWAGFLPSFGVRGYRSSRVFALLLEEGGGLDGWKGNWVLEIPHGTASAMKAHLSYDN